MDPIINKLNQAVSQKLQQSTPAAPSTKESSSPFQQTLDQNYTDRIMDKLKEDYAMGPKSSMQVLSADDVHVNNQSAELGENQGKSGDQIADLFKGMNRDMVNLDATIETLTTPGVKLTTSQLFALQAGVANTGLMAECFTRFVDSVAGGIKQIVQMQV